MIFTNVLMIFWHKRKINNVDPYNVFLAISTNIPQRLKTGFVVQGHICVCVCVCVFIFSSSYSFLLIIFEQSKIKCRVYLENVLNPLSD